VRIAVDRGNSERLIVAFSEGQPKRSTNGGATLQPIKGLPNGPKRWSWAQPLASDLVSSGRYYYLSSGTLFRSTDGGATFSTAVSGLPGDSFASVKAMPEVAGEVWCSFGRNGLYRVTGTAAMSASKLTTVGDARAVALGKPMVSGQPAAVYLYGSTKSGSTESWGVFRSADRGSTWTRIDLPERAMGNIGHDNQDIILLEASRQTAGMVFLGSDGRGIYLGWKP
jgi:xyloglucan-specific exo-beta-1,4-glucanase